MKHLILACLLFGSAYSYEARLFGQFGISKSFLSNFYDIRDGFKFKFGYEQNITDRHIFQAHYVTFFKTHSRYGSQFLGLNYIYELPLQYGFLGFYGGFDLGVATVYPFYPGFDRRAFGFDADLNIGTRYRTKNAFVEFELNPISIVASIGIMFNL